MTKAQELLAKPQALRFKARQTQDKEEKEKLLKEAEDADKTAKAETLEAARATLKDGQQLTRQVDARLVPLLESLTATSKTAQV